MLATDILRSAEATVLCGWCAVAFDTYTDATVRVQRPSIQSRHPPIDATARARHWRIGRMKINDAGRDRIGATHHAIFCRILAMAIVAVATAVSSDPAKAA